MLAMWMFFWDTTDWIPAPPSASAAEVVVTSGGAQGKDYHPLPDEFWEIREQHILSTIEPVLRSSKKLSEAAIPSAETITPAQQETKKEIIALRNRMHLAAELARFATNNTDLLAATNEILHLSILIAEQRNQLYFDQAAVILLLDML